MNALRTSPESEPSTAVALSDELLAIRCQLGDRSALDALVDRWHGPLWQYVRRMSADDDAAAETVQDVWLRVLRALPALRDPARLRAWLFSIARRALMDRLRDQYAAPIDDVEIETLAADDDALEAAESSEALQHALAQLPVAARETLVLFYLHELSLGQIAEILSVPAGTVKSRLFNARALLRRELEHRGWP